MAELALAGSVAGLISLSIQTCKGLTSYYHDFKTRDEQISSTYFKIDNLRKTCEILSDEMQKIDNLQNTAAQNVDECISQCQNGIEKLQEHLRKCHSSPQPHDAGRAIISIRSRVFYPFRKRTLDDLKNTADEVQANLHRALQVLNLHLHVLVLVRDITNKCFVGTF